MEKFLCFLILGGKDILFQEIVGGEGLTSPHVPLFSTALGVCPTNLKTDMFYHMNNTFGDVPLI